MQSTDLYVFDVGGYFVGIAQHLAAMMKMQPQIGIIA